VRHLSFRGWEGEGFHGALTISNEPEPRLRLECGTNAYNRLASLDILVIDEISMMSDIMLISVVLKSLLLTFSTRIMGKVGIFLKT